MSAPRLRGLLRPVPKAPQCLYQKRIEAIPKTSIQCQLRQKRCQSTQSISPHRPRIQSSVRWQTLQRRYRSSQTIMQAIRGRFQESPYRMSLALACVIIPLCCGPWIYWYYHNYIKASFHKFPEPVAKELRRAVYYSSHTFGDFKPKEAVRYFNRTLQKAEEIGMDPFSAEIIGVKIRLAEFMEQLQLYQKAIDVLEIIKRDNLKWVDLLGNKPGNEGKRTRVLRTSIEVSVKLGELYANQYVDEKEMAEERLVWAVETMLKEQQRREKEGVKEGEGEWMSPEEIGGTLEALGNTYETSNQHYLAAPLFLQALAVSPVKSCHTIVLMNNLSISLAQQLPPPYAGQAPASRSALVENARAWAEKAIAVAAKITPPERTRECDIGCAVATHNLGEFAEMNGDIAEARRRFEEAKSLAKAIDFQEGVINAETGLRRTGKT